MRGYLHPTTISASYTPFGILITFEDLSTDSFGEYSSIAAADQFAITSHEHICLVRGNLVDHKVVGVQFQTSYGRRSAWYGQTGSGVRFERASPEPGLQIVGVTHDGIKTSRLPPPPKVVPLRSLVMSSTVRALVLKRGSGTKKSLAGQSLKGGSRSVLVQSLRSGLASRLLRKNSEGQSLLRIVLDGEKDADDKVDVPQSLLRALAEKPDNFEHSLMDLLFADGGKSKPPLVRLFFAGGKKSVASVVFAHRKDGQPSLAQLLFSQDRQRGLRSILQLVTDDEVLDDPDNPSMLRMMLQGEEDEARWSVMRLVLTRFGDGTTTPSLLDELLRFEAESEGSVVRRLVTQTDSQRSLLRDFLTDTPGGKPALGRFVLGGEDPADVHSHSLVRLMVQGESRDQASLLRLLLCRGSNQPALVSLLTGGHPSVLDIVMRGEETAAENSLARICLGVTIKIERGSISLGGALGSDPGGLTLAKAAMLGEEDGGPGISVLRMLLLGEDTTGMSVLRLLLFGEAQGQVSPLRVIFTGFQSAFVAAKLAHVGVSENKSWVDTALKIAQAVTTTVKESHVQGSTWKDSIDRLMQAVKSVALDQSTSYINFLWAATKQIAEFGPEFNKAWVQVWTNVGREIRRTGDRVRPGSDWKTLAPECAVLTEHVARQDWQKALMQLAVVLSFVESKNRNWMGTFSKWVPMFG